MIGNDQQLKHSCWFLRVHVKWWENCNKDLGKSSQAFCLELVLEQFYRASGESGVEKGGQGETETHCPACAHLADLPWHLEWCISLSVLGFPSTHSSSVFLLTLNYLLSYLFPHDVFVTKYEKQIPFLINYPSYERKNLYRETHCIFDIIN